MNGTWKSSGVGVFVGCLLTVGSSFAQEEVLTSSEINAKVDPARVTRTRVPAGAPLNFIEIEKRDDLAGDPPALLEESRIDSLKAVAAQLSADRSWLTAGTLAALSAQNLRLDELFAKAPRQIQVDGVPYRILVEKVGELWGDFDASVDPYAVFLNHEIYDGLGEDRALAFQDGDETVLFAWDFERIPAFAVTLERLAPEEMQSIFARLQTVETPVTLGRHRLALHRGNQGGEVIAGAPRELDFLGSTLTNVAGADTCAPEIAPTSCASGKPVCDTTGYTPYFVVSAIKIKTDHEGCCFRGNPEIELFPLRLDATSPAGGTTNATSNFIFSGRTVTDIAGRSRYLPDINDNNIWYSVANGLAVYPTNSGMEWSSTLVEDDDTTGVLKMNANRLNVTKLYKTVSTIVQDNRQLNFFYLLKLFGQFLDLIGLFDDGDDLYQESIGVANGLFCANGLGQPFPKTFTLVSQEWELQGYYACVNPSCTPPTGGGGGGGGGGVGCMVVTTGNALPTQCP